MCLLLLFFVWDWGADTLQGLSETTRLGLWGLWLTAQVCKHMERVWQSNYLCVLLGKEIKMAFNTD